MVGGGKLQIKKLLRNHISNYDSDKYWYMYKIVANPSRKYCGLLIYYYYYRMKKMERFHNAFMGILPRGGYIFKDIPILPHGLSGIVISEFSKIGCNCTIFHSVTIGQDNKGNAPVIGDNCLIGTGVVIFGKVRIGNNVHIGANVVVSEDIPDDSTIIPANFIYKKRQGNKLIENEVITYK